MSGSIERSLDGTIKYGAVFTEVSFPTCGSTQNEQDTDTCQSVPVAQAVFGVASVTVEVCARYWHIGDKITLDGLALEGTNQV